MSNFQGHAEQIAVDLHRHADQNATQSKTLRTAAKNTESYRDITLPDNVQVAFLLIMERTITHRFFWCADEHPVLGHRSY